MTRNEYIGARTARRWREQRDKFWAQRDDLRDQLAQARAEIARLSTPTMWWRMDDDSEALPGLEEYAADCDMKVGNTFTVQAARHLPDETYRVVSIGADGWPTLERMKEPTDAVPNMEA